MCSPTHIADHDDPRAITGEWRILPYNSEIEAVHMALLHNGKVLFYSGFRVAEGVKTETRIWNPATGEIKAPFTPGDLFCAGHSFLPDGRLLSTGGTLEYRNLPKIPPWLVRLLKPITPILVRIFGSFANVRLEPTGTTFLYLFDPNTEQWEFAGDMPEGRWYPTNTTLPDGRILILSGSNEGGGFGTGGRIQINRRIEVYDALRGLEHLGTIPDFETSFVSHQHGSNDYQGNQEPSAETFPSLYPRMHVLPLTKADQNRYPAGKVFCSGYGPLTKMLNPHDWEWADVSRLNWGARDDGCAVLLPLRPPDYRARILTFGGSQPGGKEEQVTATAEMIDFSEDPPTWKWARSMKNKRINAGAVILPDGKVLAIGGNSMGLFDDPVFEVEVFDPDDETWSLVAPLRVPRGYHSTYLLLPDGRVLTAGTTPLGHWELRMEVYSPYYLFKGARPAIIKAPKKIFYDKPFELHYRCDNGKIKSIALLRSGAFTHAFDMEQRYVELEIKTDQVDRLVIAPPDNEHVAQPGYYMLFLLSSKGVPSQAAFVQLNQPVTPRLGERGTSSLQYC